MDSIRFDDRNGALELTEAQIDILLRVANSELLRYVHEVTDTSAGLVRLMEQSTGCRLATTTPPGNAAVITLRGKICSLVRDLANSDGLAGDLASALARTHALTHDLDLAAARAERLVHSLARSGALITDIARDLVLTCELGHIHDHARTLVNDLTNNHANVRDSVGTLACDVAYTSGLDHARRHAVARAETNARDVHQLRLQARNLLFLLAAIPIDVSGLDLSSLEMTEPAALIGIIWTEATVWPTSVATLVRAQSQEIHEGVYRVRANSDREHADLALR